jgi:1-acyl-sn-glycerol-3-phosphate acyltransferase
VSEPAQRAAHRFLRRARQLRIVLSFALYCLLSPFGYLLFALLWLVGTRDPCGRARRTQRFTAGAYRLMHDWLRWVGIVRFDHRGALTGLPPGPCVVVANHPTLMDVTSITAALGGGCTIAKPALYRRRLLHPLLVGAMHIEGPGGDPGAVGRVVDQAVARLADGFSLIIFPEGTRSAPGRLHRFGRTAFEIACRARVPVVSVAIRCEPMWLSKEETLFDPPHPAPHLQLMRLATDDPARVDYDSRRLRKTVERRFQGWFDGGRLGDRTGQLDTVIARDGRCPTISKTA